MATNFEFLSHIRRVHIARTPVQTQLSWLLHGPLPMRHKYVACRFQPILENFPHRIRTNALTVAPPQVKSAEKLGFFHADHQNIFYQQIRPTVFNKIWKLSAYLAPPYDERL
jgi:hypothetical protein